MSILVGDTRITEHEVHDEMRHHPAPTRAAAQHHAARALVVRALLLSEARRRGLCDATSELDEAAATQAIRLLTEVAVAVPSLEDSAVRAYYEANRDRFRGPDVFAPSHILFAAGADDIEGRIEAKQAAQEVLRALSERPQRFERIAQERSACPSGAGGGSLGQIQRGETVGEFERALRTLEPGQLAPAPIETEHGFHVLRLDARVRGERVPLSSVEDRIRIYLRDRAWRAALRLFIDGLAADTPIRGFDLHTTPDASMAAQA